MRTRIAALASTMLTLAACGQAPAETVGPPSTTSPPVSEPLVEFEAFWLCDVQRYAFVDLAEIAEHQLEALQAAGFSEADYSDFKLRLEDDEAMRAEVKERFVEECAAVEPVGEDAE